MDPKQATELAEKNRVETADVQPRADTKVEAGNFE